MADPVRTTYRYTRVAMALHWAIAILVMAMIPMGIWMSDAITDPKWQGTAYRIFQLHKSIGFLILALTIARGLWRLGHRPPPGAPSLAPWERFLARATHAAFYAILLLLPLSGWIYVSTGWAIATDQPLNVATSFFGLFGIPHIGGIASADVVARRLTAYRSMSFHWMLSLGAIALIALHIAAALKHQYADRDGTLASMVPWMPAVPGAPPSERRGKLLPAIVGVVAIFLAALLPTVAGLVYNPPRKDMAQLKPAAQAKAQSAIPETVEPGTAAAWTVAKDATLKFTGVHAGNKFAGGFRTWQPHVYFDEANLAGSKIVILIDTGSAYTGDATQEGTLRETEWFDVQTYPKARFDSTNIAHISGDRYAVEGTLRVKDRTVPVKFEARIRVSGSTAEASGTFVLDRTALDMGMASDPTADWVSREIPMTFEMKATRK